MVHKRYIKRGEKVFGPYYYESYRDKNGKTRKRYVKNPPVTPQKKNNAPLIRIALVLLMFLTISAIFVLYPQEQTKRVLIAGRASFTEEKVAYAQQEFFTGDVTVSTKKGEFLAADTQVRVSYNNYAESFILSDFVDTNVLKPTEGTFYVENTDVSGEGLGYGIPGEKITYEDVDFTLEIYYPEESNTGSGTSSNNDEETSDEQPTEEVEENTEEASESQEITLTEEDEQVPEEASETEEVTEEESEESNAEETPVEEPETVEDEPTEEDNTGDEEESSSPITGESITENAYTITGTVSHGNEFTYNLEKGQRARVISATANGEEIATHEIDLDIEDGQIILTTDYGVVEEGFGEEYLMDEVGITFKINVDNLEIPINGLGSFEIALLHDDQEIVVYKEGILLQSEGNETNESATEIPITQLKEFPIIRIPFEQSVALDLTEYFEGATAYKVKVENIDVKIADHALTLTPEAEFKGARKAIIVASNQFTSLEIPATVLVSSGAINLRKTRQNAVRVDGAPVKWKVEVQKENPEDNFNIEIPTNAESVKITKIDETSQIIEEENIPNQEKQASLITGNVVIDVQPRKKLSSQFKSWMGNAVKNLRKNLGFTANVIDEGGTEIDTTQDVVLDEPAKEYIIEYETPAPTKEETIKSNFEKEITISDPYESGYTDVIAFTELETELPESESFRLKLYWKLCEEISSQEITEITNKKANEVEENEIVEEYTIDEQGEVQGKVPENEKKTKTTACEQVEVPFDAYDLDFNGKIDYLEWIVPHLSEQNYQLVIEITNAEHLDEEYAFITDIYPEVAELDNVWSETIPQDHYVRVKFEAPLSSERDITIFPRTISGSPRIEIYEAGEQTKIAEFTQIIDNQYNKVFLSELGGEQTVFDLLIKEGSIEFDHIIDPITGIAYGVGTDNHLASINETNIYMNVTVSGTEEDTITFNLMNGALALINATSFTDGTRTMNFTGLSQGTYYFNATVNDTSGNLSSTSNRRISIDLTPPTIRVSDETPATGSFVNKTNITLGAITEEEKYVVLSLSNDGDLGQAYMPKLWMRFDDVNASGDPQDERSGGGSYDGVLNGNAQIKRGGYFGDYVELDGTNDYVGIDLGGGLDFNNTQQYTWSVWFYPSETHEGIVFSKGDIQSGRGVYLKVEDNEWVFGGGYAANKIQSGTEFISIGAWNHITITYDNGTARAWVNGVEDTDAGSAMLPGDSYNQEGYALGTDAQAQGLDFNGSIDDFIVWDRILGDEEIISLYSVQDPDTPTTINITGLSHGEENTFIGYSVDGAGNINSTTIFFTTDIVAPTIAYNEDTSTNGSTQETTSIYMNVTVTENNIEQELDSIIFRLYNNTGAVNTTTIPADNLAYVEHYQINWTGLPQGTYYFNATVNDSAGNVGTNQTYTVTIDLPDTTPPVVNFTGQTPANGSSTNSLTINLSSYDDEGEHYAFLDLDNQLTIWWRMDEVFTTTVYDNSTQGHNGFRFGGATTTEGRFGDGAPFNGASLNNISYHGGSGERFVDDNYTVSLWFYPQKNDTSQTLFRITYPRQEVGANYTRELSIKSDGTLQLQQFQGSGFSSLANIGSGVSTNQWHHLVYMYSGGNNIAYLDGNSLSFAFGGTSSGTNAAGSTFVIGQGIASGLFNGTIDEVLVFNRTLNQTEVASLYNASANQYGQSFSRIGNGVHTFRGYAVDGASNIGTTEERTITFDNTAPIINFTDPTPANGSTESADSLFINTSSSDNFGDHYSFLEFDSDVILWLQMEDTDGTTVFDSSRQGNNGTIGGDAQQTSSGRFGNGFEFDGNADNITAIIEGASFFNDSRSFSLSFWMYPRSDTVGILSRNSSVQCGAGGGPNIHINASSYLVYTICEGQSFLSSSGPIALNEWHHVSLTSNNGAMNLYINGALNDTASPIGYSESFFPLLIGAARIYPDATIYEFNGTLDEVMYFNRSLSASEVASLYNASTTPYQNNFTNLSEGSHTFTAYAVDKAGNTDSQSRTITTDALPLNINFTETTTPYSGEILILTNDLTIQTSFSGDNATIFVYNASRALIDSDYVPQSPYFAFTYSDLAPGVYYFNATAYEDNNSASTQTRTVLISPDGNGGYVNRTTKIAVGLNGFNPSGLERNDSFGASLANIGDLNGDGVQDLAVGAEWDENGEGAEGAAYILFMNRSGGVESNVKISDGLNGFNPSGLDATDIFGTSITNMGDLDGDGVQDLAVGAPDDGNSTNDVGAVYILFMNRSGGVESNVKISSGLAGFIPTGLENGDYFGDSVANIGDLDGDGVQDLAVGARLDENAQTWEGAMYVLFMNRSGGVESNVKISDGLNGFNPANMGFGHGFGTSLANIGDLDGDGVNEIAVGSENDENGESEGAVYILFMNESGGVESHVELSEGLNGFNPSGLDAFDYFGSSITNMGDLDGDGVQDLAVGAYNDENGDTREGAFYLLYLNSSGGVKESVKVSDGLAGFSPSNLDADDDLGSSIVNLGDLDGDGVQDLAVGAPDDENATGFREGAIYILNLVADTIAPGAPNITYPINGTTSYAAPTELNYTINASDQPDQCWYAINGGANATPVDCGINFTSVAYVNGQNNVTVYVNDTFGNENASTINIVLDLGAPGIIFDDGTPNANQLVDTSFTVYVSVSDSNLETTTFNLYTAAGALSQSQAYSDGTAQHTFTGLTAGNYSINVTANDTTGNNNATQSLNITVLDSCLNVNDCTEGADCILLTTCTLHNSLCTAGQCDFDNVTVNTTVYTLYDSNGDGRDLDLNASNVSFTTPGHALVFNGRQGSEHNQGSRGGDGGTINITVPWLLNTTYMNLTGIGGNSTSVAGAGEGGTVQLNFHGLIRKFNSPTPQPVLTGGYTPEGGQATTGSVIYNKDLDTCPRDADTNTDGVVLTADLSPITLPFTNIYGSEEGDEYYQERYDIDCNGRINVVDVALIAFELGTR